MSTPQIAQPEAIKQPVPADRHRFHLLDAMRGLAAILVVFFHAPPEFKCFLSAPNTFLAVDFFFCLSGFVVAYSYERRLLTHLGAREFFVLRLIRLYPFYALATAIAVLRALFLSHILQTISTFHLAALIALATFLLPSFIKFEGNRLFPFVLPAWSLFFELVANLAYAILLRLSLTARLQMRRHLAGPGIVLLYLISLAGLFVAMLHNPSLDFGADQAKAALGFLRVGYSFTAGVLLFRIFLATHWRLSPGAAVAAAAVTSTLLLGALLATFAFTSTILYQFIVITILFPAIVFLGAHCFLPAYFTAACAFLGDISYPLYMLHVPLMLPRSQALFRHPALLPFMLPVYVAVLAVASWLLTRSFDLPIRRRLTAAYRVHILALTPSQQSA